MDENTPIALLYAYKTKDAIKYGLDPTDISLAYQVKEAASTYQCEWGKQATAYFLKEFKDLGGIVKVAHTKKELVLPLAETKVQVPVPMRLLKDWGLTDLIDI